MILVNGNHTPYVHPSDRGLAYGDGVFRTMRVREGLPVFWQRHYQKLATDCARLKIECPEADILLADVKIVCADMSDCVAKIIITRGPGARGYPVPAEMQATRIVSSGVLPVYPAAYYDEGVTVRVCDLRLGWQPQLAGIKHLNRLENVMARQEWSDPAIVEGLLLDTADNVIEGTMSNVFMVRGRTLSTPDLTQCGVAGVHRQLILEAAIRNGMQIETGLFSLDDLLHADEVFLCNSIIEVWQVRQLAQKQWGKGLYSAMFRQVINDQVD